jgi:dienelactone hydrolase
MPLLSQTTTYRRLPSSFFTSLTSLAALCILFCQGTQAAGAQKLAPPPVEAYAQPAAMSSLSMSPDGRHVAYLSPIKGINHLIIQQILNDGKQKPIIFPPGENHIVGVEWKNNQRLLVVLLDRSKIDIGVSRKIPYRFTSIVSIDYDGKDPKILLKRPSDFSGYYIGAPVIGSYDDEHFLSLYPDRDRSGQDIVKVNARTGKTERLASGLKNGAGYLQDRTKKVRIAASINDKTNSLIYYILEDDGSYKRMTQSSLDDDFSILGFSKEDDNVVYAVSSHENDHSSMYLYNIRTNTFLRKVENPSGRNVEGVITRQGVVVGLTEFDDLPASHWFEPETQALQDALDQSIPDSREIIIDRSSDKNLFLVASFSLNEPVTYRLFNRQTKTFALFGDTYPALPQEAVARRQPMEFKARDGMTIPAYLTLPVDREAKNLPFIVLPHGGPSARDTGIFDTLSQFLVSRGYGVIQPNFRGSIGYGKKFADAGRNQWGQSMQDDVTDAIQWAVSKGYADPQRLCIVGWSYGGYAALMGAIKEPGLFKCAIATAPVANIPRLYDELRFAAAATNYNRTLFFNGQRNNLEKISPVHQAERAGAPILLIHGDMDAQAFTLHSREMADALKTAGKPFEYIEIPDMDHSPDTTQQMAKILLAWETFLAKHLGPAS